MKKNTKKKNTKALRPEYDFSKLKGGVKGKYARRFQAGTNLTILAPDVAKAFPTDESVNDALRMLIKVAKTSLPSN